MLRRRCRAADTRAPRRDLPGGPGRGTGREPVAGAGSPGQPGTPPHARPVGPGFPPAPPEGCGGGSGRAGRGFANCQAGSERGEELRREGGGDAGGAGGGGARGVTEICSPRVGTAGLPGSAPGSPPQSRRPPRPLGSPSAPPRPHGTPPNSHSFLHCPSSPHVDPS